MKTFLISVAGMFVGGILLLVVLWYGLKFLIRRFVNKLVSAIQAFGPGVPPFRITLDEADDLEWSNTKAIDGVARALAGVGYTLIGDYRIPEMPTVKLRAFVNSKSNTYAVAMEVNDKVVVDIACDFADGDHTTVSNAPETGLDRPDWSRLTRVEADLVADPAAAVKLHERMLTEQRGRPTVVAKGDAFPAVFIRAHTREMDWRIARGGITPEEVRRSCEATGTEIPEDEAVEMVVAAWRNAISQFVDDQLREKFLKHITKMSAAEWEEVRDRLYFVHEHSDSERVIDAIAWRVPGSADASQAGEEDDEDEEVDAARARLRPLFAGTPVREAFANAQELLPADRRYRRVAGIKTPYGADVYVEPAGEDDEDEDNE